MVASRRLLSLLFFFLILVPSVAGQRPRGTRVAPPNGYTPGMGGSSPDLPGYTPGRYANDEDNVRFQSNTVLVQVSVVITDKAGQHVHGLTRDNFQVLEDGREQRLSSVEEITATQKPVSVARTKAGQFTNLIMDRDQPHTVTVIALDTVNTPFLDQAYARKELLRYLSNNIDSNQPLALVLFTSQGLKIVSGLTSSVPELQDALKKLTGEASAMQGVTSRAEVAAFTEYVDDFFAPRSPANVRSSLDEFLTRGDVAYAQLNQERAILTTMQSFLTVAWSLSGIPGRKTLIWATGGFPFTMDSPAAVPGGQLSVIYERAMRALDDAQVSIYPVDVQGLVNYSLSASVRTPTASTQRRQISNRAWLIDAKQDTLKDFAEMTGGRAFYNTNDLTSAFRRAVDDSSTYYLLGYYLDTKNTKPGWRGLKVNVKEKQFFVRARKGFFVTNSTMNPEATRVNDVNFALAAPFDATQIPILMEWGPIHGGGDKKEVSFTLHIAGASVSVEGVNNSVNLAVAATATRLGVKKELSVADNFGEDVRTNLPAEKVATFRSRGMAYNNKLQLPPGEYSVRFVVRDNHSGALGSVSAPITVN